MRQPTKRQSGFTLIEITLAIALMSGVLVGLSWLANQYTGTIKKQAAAQYMINWKEAANKYIKNNSAMIMAGAPYPTPYMIATSDLVTAGLLNAGTAPLNPYSQTVCAKILQPSAGVLTGLIITNGGQTLGDGDAIDVAASIGTDGGYTAAATPTTASGSYGGWSIPTTTYADCTGAATTAGHLAVALFFNNSNVMSDYVYRAAVAGHPEANQMTTPLIMSSVQTAGTACAVGAIARDPTGTILTCAAASLKWVASGASCSAVNYASLPLTGNTTGSLCTTTDFSRVYAWSGLSWLAVAVDQNGNMDVPGSLSAAGGVSYIDASGNLTLNQSGATNVGYVNPGWAVETWGCAANGSIAKAAYDIADGWAWNGTPLFCKAGVWTHQSGGGVGGYAFYLPGYGILFYGTGSYNSSSGTFSGSMTCDPATYGGQCGFGGQIWCGNNTACAYAYGWASIGYYQIGGFFYKYTENVQVAGIPVVGVGQRW